MPAVNPTRGRSDATTADYKSFVNNELGTTRDEL